MKIQEKTKVGEYLVVDDLPGLVALVQMGILEIHTWNSTADRAGAARPRRVRPRPRPGGGVDRGRRRRPRWSARASRTSACESFVKTTGGKGLHVVVPLAARLDLGRGLRASRAASRSRSSARDPRGLHRPRSPRPRRKGKILIDYLRNNRGSTSVAPYSTRARPDAPLSVPIAWDELTEALRPDQFTLANIDERLKSRKKDPWADYFQVRQRLTAAAKKAAAL